MKKREAAPYTVSDGLAIYRIGSGEPILLMPGPHRFQIPGDGSAQPLIDGLVSLGRQVISFDPPGSGHSTRPAHLSMDEMHCCADEALDRLDLRGPVDAFGHSMGGLTVLAYTLERPWHIQRLILAGTGSGGPAYMNAPGALWNRTHPHFIRLIAYATLHLVWPRLASQALILNFIERESYYKRALAEQAPVTLGDWLRPRPGHTDWHTIARTLDYAARLCDVTAPTLVLCGRHDPQFPLACSEALAAGIRTSSLVVFEHSGHYPFIEEREAFWQTVGAFFDGDLPGTELPRRPLTARTVAPFVMPAG